MKSRPKADKYDVLTLKPLVMDTLNTGLPPQAKEYADYWLLIHHTLTLINIRTGRFYWKGYLYTPVVGTMPSLASLQSLDSRLVFPAPVRPMHTTSYSGLGGGGPLQHSVRKH